MDDINIVQVNLKGKIPLLFVGFMAWILIISSCANQGMPIGGPKDTIPPVLVSTDPEMRSLHFDGDEVSFTFNEYVVPEGVNEALVVSPPLQKRPVVRTKGKSIQVQFKEDLKENATYSLDFKNSIVDNNEKNPYPNFRFAFSTGDVFDSLRIAGKLVDAFNLEFIDQGLVLLHSNLHDSAVYRVRPDYIAKTDESGLFLFDNISPGTYHLFAINDMNRDMMYNEGAEPIAFLDTLIVPSAHFHEELDTLVQGIDSMLVLGHTHFYPEPMYLRLFTEEIYDQYLVSAKRETRYTFNVLFNETVRDTFNLKLLNRETGDEWLVEEPSTDVDSLVYWIADTTIANVDSLLMELSYAQLDSTGNVYIKKDTVDMIFTDRVVEVEKKKRRSGRKEEEEETEDEIVQFGFETNIGSNFDVNNNVFLVAPSPVAAFDYSMINLYLKSDTLKQPLNYTFGKDTTRYRTYRLSFDWDYDSQYVLEVDSAACTDIYGVTNSFLQKTIKTREEDYYGSILLNLTNVSGPMIFQVLKNDDEENVIVQKKVEKDEKVVFDYLAPNKYKVKVIYDENGNGEWDNGSFQDKVQPERVAYLNEVVKVRSNFDTEFKWDVRIDFSFTKNIRDLELEEKLRKQAEEKKLKERENPSRKPLQNNMFEGSGAGSPGSFQR